MTDTVPCRAVDTAHGIIYVPANQQGPAPREPARRAAHGSGVREFCEQLLQDGGLSHAEIAAGARARFGGATSEASVRWYASKMKRRLSGAGKAEIARHVVLAHLLARGFACERTGASNASQMTCHADGREIRVRVRGCFEDERPFRASGAGPVFPDLQPADFVALCDLRQGVREADVYVVPTRILEQELAADHAHWLAARASRDLETTTRVLRFDGNPRPDNIAYGYASRLVSYRNAWELLDQA